MPVVYDRQTEKPVDVPLEDAHAGLVSGQYALDADAGPVTLRGKDGALFTAPPDKVAGALATGAYSMLSPEEEQKQAIAKQEAARGVTGSIVEGVRSAANQALLGIPSTYAEATDTPAQHAAREAREGEHKVARTIGGLAGFGASMALGSGELEAAGQAAEHVVAPLAERVAGAGLAAQMATKAAGAATQGAILSAPQALVQGIVGGDPKKAAETLLWGIGAGGALGMAGEAFSSGAKAAAGAAADKIATKLADPKAAEFVDQWANNRIFKMFGGSVADANKLGQDGTRGVKAIGDFAYENELLQPGKTRQEIGDLVTEARKKWGGQMGEALDSLDGLLERGHQTPEVLDKALKPGQLGDVIRNSLDSEKMHWPMNSAQADAVKLVADSADMLKPIDINGRSVVPFKTAQDFVSDLYSKWTASIQKTANQGGIKGVETVTALDRVKAAAYEFARDAMHDAGDAVAVASGAPELVNKLAAAKMQYAKLRQIETLTMRLQATAAGNRMVGLTDFLHMGNGPGSAIMQTIGAGVGGAIAGPGGAMVGSQVGRLPGLALDFLGKRLMEDKGLVIMSSLAKRVAKEGPEVFTAAMVAEAKKRLEATMGGIATTVRQMAIGSTRGAPMASDHMKHLLGSTTGLTPDQSYAKLGARLNALAADPGAMVSVAANASAPFAAASPELGAAYQQQVTTALQYLHDAMPKPPAPPAPFAPDDWSPSANDKLAFHDKAEIVSNPMRAMVHLQHGTLSDAHIDALQTIYPRILGTMRNELLTYAAEHPDVKLPAAEQRSASKLLGLPLDTPSQHLPALQASYATPSSQGQGQPSQPATQRAQKAKIKNMPSAASAFTGSQGPSPAGA